METTKKTGPIKDVVLVGAGHAHVQVLKSFGTNPVAGVRLTLLTKDVRAPYSGMLPGLVAGLYDFDDAHIDTRPLCRFAGAQLHQTTCIGIDRATKTVICDDRPPVPYDILSLDTGSTPNTQSVPGAAEHAVPVKPVSNFLERFEAMRTRILDARGVGHVAVVGGGAGGVELLLSIERRLRRDLSDAGHDPSALRFSLITAEERILPGFPDRFGRRFETILQERGIALLTGSPVTQVNTGSLCLGGRRTLAADEVLWTTEAKAPDWLRETGLRLDGKGFLCVDANLRAPGAENIFGAGDVIAFEPRPLPKSGVYAVRAGPVLTDNIRRLLSGQKLKHFEPQREAMYLVSTGEPYAIGTRNGFVFGGKWVWHFKDWIDRRFMRQFKDLLEKN